MFEAVELRGKHLQESLWRHVEQIPRDIELTANLREAARRASAFASRSLDTIIIVEDSELATYLNLCEAKAHLPSRKGDRSPAYPPVTFL